MSSAKPQRCRFWSWGKGTDLGKIQVHCLPFIELHRARFFRVPDEDLAAAAEGVGDIEFPRVHTWRIPQKRRDRTVERPPPR